MSARLVLNTAELMLREAHEPEEVDAMLHPPSHDDDRNDRIEHLRALGIEVA